MWAALMFLLCGVRSTGALGLHGFVAPCDHVLDDLIVPGQVTGRLTTWLHGPSLQSATFGFQQLFLGSLLEMMEGQHVLRPDLELGTGLSRGPVGSRSGRRVVVVVVGQQDVGAVSRMLLLMQRCRRPQLPASFLQLPCFAAQVQPIAAGDHGHRVVVFDVANVGFIAVSWGSVQHFLDARKT